jgi:nucleoside-diphosphate-sugar epimerase
LRILIIGGTGQIGAAVVQALAAQPSCAEIVMVNRTSISLTANYPAENRQKARSDPRMPRDAYGCAPSDTFR